MNKNQVWMVPIIDHCLHPDNILDALHTSFHLMLRTTVAVRRVSSWVRGVMPAFANKNIKDPVWDIYYWMTQTYI